MHKNGGVEDIVVGGIYRHNKTGNLYKVRAIGRHTETGDDFIVYERSDLTDGPPMIWLRPIEMWSEVVDVPDSSEVTGCRPAPRFELVRSHT